jgi:hypothetical protein
MATALSPLKSPLVYVYMMLGAVSPYVMLFDDVTVKVKVRLVMVKVPAA